MLANKTRCASKQPKFLAIADNGLIWDSLNGTAWTQRASTGFQLRKSIYVKALGLWIVGAVSGQILTSPDGINWTNRGIIGEARGFAYGNGIIVCITQGGIFTSTNGINWTSRTSSLSTHSSICFAAGKFVVGGADGTNARHAYSTNGIAWTLGSSPGWPVANAPIINYSPSTGRFIWVGNSSNRAYSYDGVAFTNFSYSEIFGNGASFMTLLPNYLLFMIANANQLFTSYDGDPWTDRGYPVGYASGVAYNPQSGLYVVSSSTGVWTSTNLTSWAFTSLGGATTDVIFGGD